MLKEVLFEIDGMPKMIAFISPGDNSHLDMSSPYANVVYFEIAIWEYFEGRKSYSSDLTSMWLFLEFYPSIVIGKDITASPVSALSVSKCGHFAFVDGGAGLGFDNEQLLYQLTTVINREVDSFKIKNIR